MGLKELFQSSAVVLQKDYFQGMFVVDYLLEVVFCILQGNISVQCTAITSSSSVIKDPFLNLTCILSSSFVRLLQGT